MLQLPKQRNPHMPKMVQEGQNSWTMIEKKGEMIETLRRHSKVFEDMITWHLLLNKNDNNKTGHGTWNKFKINSKKRLDTPWVWHGTEAPIGHISRRFWHNSRFDFFGIIWILFCRLRKVMVNDAASHAEVIKLIVLLILIASGRNKPIGGMLNSSCKTPWVTHSTSGG